VYYLPDLSYRVDGIDRTRHYPAGNSLYQAPEKLIFHGDKIGTMRKKRYPSVLKKSGHQVGTSVKRIDRPLDAMPPGQRRSRKGKKYWETRKNRSDLFGNI